MIVKVITRDKQKRFTELCESFDIYDTDQNDVECFYMAKDDRFEDFDGKVYFHKDTSGNYNCTVFNDSISTKSLDEIKAFIEETCV